MHPVLTCISGPVGCDHRQKRRGLHTVEVDTVAELFQVLCAFVRPVVIELHFDGTPSAFGKMDDRIDLQAGTVMVMADMTVHSLRIYPQVPDRQ